MTRFWLAASVCLLLTACGATARQDFPRHYALTGGVTAAPHDRKARTRRETLRVTRVTAPAWLQGTGLYYQLRYRHDHSIAAYTQSDWVAPPARMLERLLQATLAQGGEWKAVVGPASPAHADFSLRIRLDDFSQVFTSPQQSHGVLDATATLVRDADGGAIAQTHFRLHVTAPSADAAGGVKALNRASHEFATRLGDWLERSLQGQPQRRP